MERTRSRVPRNSATRLLYLFILTIENKSYRLLDRRMFRNKQTAQTFLLIWGIIFFSFLVYYNTVILNANVVRRGLDRIEPFQTAGAPVVKATVEDSVETIGTLEPDRATIDKPREPYNLLKDVLPASRQRVSPTSQRCYEADFQTRIEKTGDYRQLTNNYKRGTPDSCSSPLHEYVLSFYEAQPVP